MRVKIYLTANGSAHGTAPVLYLADHPGETVPPHPDGHAWAYFATVDIEDPLLLPEGQRIAEALASGVTYVAEQLPF